MDLKNIIEFQKKFDVAHGWDWANFKNDEEMLKKLQYITIALGGEQGEFSNIVKKILREFNQNKSVNQEHMKHLKEELVDIFAYTLVAAEFFNMDLEKAYFEKMKFNEERFKKFMNGPL